MDTLLKSVEEAVEAAPLQDQNASFLIVFPQRVVLQAGGGTNNVYSDAYEVVISDPLGHHSGSASVDEESAQKWPWYKQSIKQEFVYCGEGYTGSSSKAIPTSFCVRSRWWRARIDTLHENCLIYSRSTSEGHDRLGAVVAAAAVGMNARISEVFLSVTVQMKETEFDVDTLQVCPAVTYILLARGDAAAAAAKDNEFLFLCFMCMDRLRSTTFVITYFKSLQISTDSYNSSRTTLANMPFLLVQSRLWLF